MSISASDKGMRPGVCTSTNRPANPYVGMVIYETDTSAVRVWNGSAWISVASATSLVISSAGYVNMANQPIISGRVGSFATGALASDQIIPFDEFWVSRGITYNATTRRFTVPIAGVYRITINPFFNTGSGAGRVTVGINTDTPSSSNNWGHAYREASTYDTVAIDSVVSLNANDYIVFRINQGALYNFTSDRFTQFSIQLVG
jgi:hypothetical protein